MSRNQREHRLKLATLAHIEIPSGRPWLGLAIICLALLVASAVLFFLVRAKQGKLDVYKTLAELHFADPALEECVRSTGEANGWSQVGLFTSLHCNNPSGGAIQSLGGLEHLVELTDVNLAFNEIADIRPLARLPRLTTVDLSHNRIERLPVLHSSPSIKRLELNHNSLDSLKWLSSQHFPQLDTLSVANNQIADVAAVASLDRLRELNIRDNRIAELGPVGQLKELVMLDAGGNLFSDLFALGGLKELRRLFLDGNQISSLEGLGSLQQLEELDLSGNPIHSAGPLAELYRLQRLSMNYTGISRLDDILSLGDLEVLEISDNPELECEAIAAAVQEYGAAAIISNKDCPQAPGG